MYIDILRWPAASAMRGYIFICRCPVDAEPVSADGNGCLACAGEFT